MISALLLDFRIIHCTRDPLDTCLSCYQLNFEAPKFTRSLQSLGFYYRHYRRLMDHWKEVLPARMLELRYKDLVADPEAVSRRMVNFCGLEWDDRCLRFQENPRAVQTASMLQVRRPVYQSSVGRWRRYKAHLGPLIEALGPSEGERLPHARQVEHGKRSVPATQTADSQQLTAIS